MHPKLLIAAISLALLASAAARADDDVLDARVQLGSVSARDDLLVPLAFTGPGLELAARYEHAFARDVLAAQLGLGAALMFERFGQPALQLPNELALGYARALDTDATQRWELGATLRFRNEISFLASWDDAHGYWLATLSINPWLRYARKLSQDVWLEGEGELALVGLAARPPSYRFNKQDAMTHLGYFFDRLEGAKAFAPWDVQWVRFELLARFRDAGSARGAGWGVGPAVRLSRASDPKPYTVLYVGVMCARGWEL